MRLSILTLLAALLPLSANAWDSQYGSTYDPSSGNSYNWNRNYDGSTTVRGMNTYSGSTWTQTIQQNGDQRGFDSDGNSWSYDSGSGVYQNYGTGRTCMGSGQMRQCF